ncbi:MAG: adenylate kinase [Nanoarchaeota archaeon]|nr:adenylate kinase [Nanoarchaeota archaeon]MBU4352385.1 adenylate kinase [Nanoarchaeota archaeon]MBU4455975.1 adenylate kinase [Nanoarchaeota archaeon]MCG2719367.1 adenylate kinase [Nanoarchaeota archaeon]
MNAIFLGPPGTGKGTQAERISVELGIAHISTGEMFRQLANEGNPVGVEAKEKYWGKGNLVPDDLTIKLVKERLAKEDCKKGFILDGFPRTIPQAEALDKITKISKVIDIESSEEIIIKRLSNRRQCSKCKKIYGIDVPPKKEGICDICQGKLIQRDDDREEVIRDRLKVYEKQTKPLIKYYKEKLITVDGEQPIDKIKQDIIKAISLK